MKESFLHFIWKYKLFSASTLRTIDGTEIAVLNSGVENYDAGPDFFNGKIKMNQTIWAGNIEVHVNSSEWYTHQHHKDKSYHNVILHVVYNYDKPVYDNHGNEIPTIELKQYINENLLANYHKLIKAKDWIPCQQQIRKIDDTFFQLWMNRLAVERLERKSDAIIHALEKNNHDWDETFYQYLCKYFGLKVNAVPFELLAIKTPLKYIEKHNTIISIEALLYGQAGFLNKNFNNDYYNTLKKEYKFLKNKFHLQPLDNTMWKFLRMRPASFPTIRISQLANLLQTHPRLFSKLIETDQVEDIYSLFNCCASEYWNKHYSFTEKSSSYKEKRIGNVLIKSIIINVIVPFMFVYGKLRDNQEMIDKSLNSLEMIEPERNNIIRKWDEIGVKATNSLQTQSLLELKNIYCSEKKCLNCSIGNKILQL